MDAAHEKQQALLTRLAALGGVAAAFSAGVDSTYLLNSAVKAGCRVLAVTVDASAVPRRETKAAEDFCRANGIGHQVIAFDQFTVPAFVHNAKDRCYHCKKALFSEIIKVASEKGISHVIEGSNADDALVYRPGMRAVEELGVLSPLLEAGLTKAEIRLLSAEAGLSTASKPSLSCLATRFPYGETLTPEKLAAVEAGESYLFSLGLRQARVRVHGELARIEALPSDFPLLTSPGAAAAVAEKLRSLGFKHVTLDLAGFRSGSMDE